MYGNENLRVFRYPNEAATVFLNRGRLSEHRVRRGRAHRNDEPRLYQGDLALEPRTACFDLELSRRFVDAAPAARLELEVLDGVGDVDACAIDASITQTAVEELPCRADERAA